MKRQLVVVGNGMAGARVVEEILKRAPDRYEITMFGAALYVLNFHGMSSLFPWMTELRGWASLIGHLVFGMTVALTYPALERRRSEQ